MHILHLFQGTVQSVVYPNSVCVLRLAEEGSGTSQAEDAQVISRAGDKEVVVSDGSSSQVTLGWGAIRRYRMSHQRNLDIKRNPMSIKSRGCRIKG